WNASPFAAAGSGTTARAGVLFWKVAAGGETSIAMTANTSCAVLCEQMEYHSDVAVATLQIDSVASVNAIGCASAAASTTYTTPSVSTNGGVILTVCGVYGRSTGTYSAETLHGVNIAG